MSSGCCPVRSEPYLPSNHEPRGEEKDLDGLSIYFIGSGEKAVIVFYDIFGYNGGRTRLICDQLADNGYFVALPDIYHGEAWPPEKPKDTLMAWLKTFPWNTSIKSDTYKLIEHMKTLGAKSFACLGFCSGAYSVFHLCCDEMIKCGLSMHPSVQIGSNFGETPEGIARSIKCPQLVYSAEQDLPTYREGGEVFGILNEKFTGKNDIKVFPDMVHGWVSRGKLEDVNVARDVKLAMEGALEFLKEYL